MGRQRTIYGLRDDEGDHDRKHPDGHILGQGHRAGRVVCLYADQRAERWHHSPLHLVVHRQLQLGSRSLRPGTELSLRRTRMVAVGRSEERGRTDQGLRRRLRTHTDRPAAGCEQALCQCATEAARHADPSEPLGRGLGQTSGGGCRPADWRDHLSGCGL